MSSIKGGPLGLLGLARRAGMVEQGVSLTRKALSQGRANLVLMARDGSKIQKDKIVRVLRHKSVPAFTWGTCEDLGAIFGAKSVAAVAVTNSGMAKQMMQKLPKHLVSQCERTPNQAGDTE